MIGGLVTAALRFLQLQKLWNSTFVQKYVGIAEAWYRVQPKQIKYAVGVAILAAIAVVLFA